MSDEEALFERLELWLAQQPQPVTIFDVLAAPDKQIAAAYILKAFRSGARDAVIERLEREGRALPSDASAPHNPLLRVFARLADAWKLDRQERYGLLGVPGDEEYVALEQTALKKVPVDVLERVSTLLTIFETLGVLLPIPERADSWIRKPNRAPLFKGHSALDLMLERGPRRSSEIIR